MERQRRSRWIGVSTFLAVAAVWLVILPLTPRAAGTPEGTPGTPAESLATPAGTPAASSLVRVEIEDNTFVPWRLRVPAGTTVFWSNRDTRAHTVSAEDGSFDSDRLGYTAGFRHTFTEPGVYGYLCRYHNDMSGTVIVE